MKLLLLFYFSSCLLLHAEDNKVYYDSEGKITTSSQATFYRISNQYPIADRFQMTDFYMNGIVAASGAYMTSSHTIKDGEFVYYYPNGQVKSKGIYKENLRLGEWKWWYPNGQEMKESLILHTNSLPNEEIELTINFWDADGNHVVRQGKGELIQYNEHQYVGELRVLAKGSILDGLKHGPWQGYDYNGNLLYKELYQDGILLRGKAFVENGSKIRYNTLSKAPMPVGGVNNLRKHIVNSLKYPRNARYENISGQVLVQFVVDEDGSIHDVQTIKGIGGGCDEEAERVIQSFGDWEPGVQRGQLRTSRMIMPISFEIQ
ncbi:MAG: TonB family protein [Cyclobacteriaceae bacterium]